MKYYEIFPLQVAMCLASFELFLKKKTFWDSIFSSFHIIGYRGDSRYGLRLLL